MTRVSSATEIDSSNAFPAELWTEMGELGLLGITVDEAYGGVPCRRYEVGECAVTVVYYHGGGFVVGGLDSHDDVCAEICARTGYRVISVDYGLAPEVVWPGCFNDAWAAFEAIAAAF